MKTIILFLISFFIIVITYSQKNKSNDLVIAKGQMPNITKDKNNNIHLVYGSGDSIMYISSKDGNSFTSPSLVAVLPKVLAIAMRGPQIAAATNGLVVTACTNNGNIFSYKKRDFRKMDRSYKSK